MDQIEFQDSSLSDLEFLDTVNTICMREHVERVMEWCPSLFRESFDPSVTRIILFKGTKIGLLKVFRQPKELYLEAVMILPEYQNQGLGESAVRFVMEEAAKAGLPVCLQVLKGNPAKRLYDRLGFTVMGQDDCYIKMCYAV